MSASKSSGQTGWDGLSFTNVADGNSLAGAEFGILFDEDTYQVLAPHTPREKYLTGLRLLDAKVTGRAQELIGQAVAKGFEGGPEGGSPSDPTSKITANHVAYHWVLAALSGRSFEQLEDRQLDVIDAAKELPTGDHGDPWAAARGLVIQLIDDLLRQGGRGGEERELEPLLPRLGSLPGEIREKVCEDFERHLYLILEDTSQRSLLADLAQAAAAKRMSHGRKRRAWKFFEAVPEPPWVRRVKEPSFSRSAVITATSGFLLGALGLGLSLYVITAASVIRGVLLVLLFGVSGFALYRSGIERLAAGGRLADKDKEYGIPTYSRYSAKYILTPPVTSQTGSGGSPPDSSAKQETPATEPGATKGEQEATAEAGLQAAQAAPDAVQAESQAAEAGPKGAEPTSTSPITLFLGRFRFLMQSRFLPQFRVRPRFLWKRGTGQKGEQETAGTEADAPTAGQQTTTAGPQPARAEPPDAHAEQETTETEPTPAQPEPDSTTAEQETVAEANSQATQAEQDTAETEPQPAQPEPDATTAGQEARAAADPPTAQADPRAAEAEPEAEPEAAERTGTIPIAWFRRPIRFLRRFPFLGRFPWRGGARQKAEQGSGKAEADTAKTGGVNSLALLLHWISQQDGTGQEGEPKATKAEQEAATQAEQEAAARAAQEKAKARAAREAAQARRAIFVRVTSRRIDREFARHTPQDPPGRRSWEADTAPIKEAMREEIIGDYQGARPGSVNWLITWRVAEIADMYEAGTLSSYKDKLRPPRWARAVLPIGTATLLFGVLALLVGTFSSRVVIGLLVLILLPLGAVIVFASRLDVYLVLRRRLPFDNADMQQRFQEENAQFEEWKSKLADRPSDAEIARWLDYDKLHLTNVAKHHLGVTDPQLITHVTLLEAAPGSRGARIVHGPPRYSTCVVTIFLLTEVGVRRIVTTLDVEDPDPSDHVRESFSDHVRQSFPYDAIVRAGFRARPADEADRPDGYLTPRRDFVLSLASREAIRFSVEKFDEDFRDVSREEQPELLDLALESSGIGSALRVMETMAALGPYWLIREWRLRRRPEPPPPKESGLRVVAPSEGSGPDEPPEKVA